MISLLTLFSLIHIQGVNTVELWERFIGHLENEAKLQKKLTSIFSDLEKLYKCMKCGYLDSSPSQKSLLNATTKEFGLSDFEEFISKGLLLKKYKIKTNEEKYSEELCDLVVKISENFIYVNNTNIDIDSDSFSDGEAVMSNEESDCESIFKKIESKKSNDQQLVQSFMMRDATKQEILSCKSESISKGGILIKVEITDVNDLKNVDEGSRWRKVNRKVVFVAKNRNDQKFVKINEALKIFLKELSKKNNVVKESRKINSFNNNASN